MSHYQACSQPRLQPGSPGYYCPNPGEVTGTISPSHVMWDLAGRLLLLSIHPLPGPGRLHTFKVLSLNVGGPHLSKKRWNQLPLETTAAQPTLIAYQEVRFKWGYNHMCQVARMTPQYQRMTQTANNPDVLFLVHRNIAQYTRLFQPAHPCGVAVEVSLPDRTAFSAANIHGPFDRRSRASLDQWISQPPHLGMLMGDFNHGKESVWPRRRRVRWWHHKLLDGTLLDPANCTTADLNSPLLTTRKGVRHHLAHADAPQGALLVPIHPPATTRRWWQSSAPPCKTDPTTESTQAPSSTGTRAPSMHFKNTLPNGPARQAYLGLRRTGMKRSSPKFTNSRKTTDQRRPSQKPRRSSSGQHANGHLRPNVY